jgi:hypothetical protein
MRRNWRRWRSGVVGGEVGLVKLRYDQNLLKSTVSRIGLALASAGEHLWIDFAGPLLPPPLNVVHRNNSDRFDLAGLVQGYLENGFDVILDCGHRQDQAFADSLDTDSLSGVCGSRTNNQQRSHQKSHRRPHVGTDDSADPLRVRTKHQGERMHRGRSCVPRPVYGRMPAGR